jgi:hypothetical protein
MASWEAVMASDLPPAPPLGAARRRGWLELSSSRRSWAALVVGGHVFGRCLGARSCAWLARTVALGFAGAAVFAAESLPETLDVVFRWTLIILSWCGGLAALCAAGPAPDRVLEAARGLFEGRAISLARLRKERPVVVALWLLRQLGMPALGVLLACLLLSRRPGSVLHFLQLGVGGFFYLLALAMGLALLAAAAQLLGRARGKALLLGLVFVPELVTPAWPEVPTVASSYASLLNLCLRQRGLP